MKTGMPKLLSDNELKPVPESERKGLWAIVAVLMAWVINPTPAIAGGSIASQMMLGTALLAIALGALILGLYSVPIAWAGSKEGVSTAVISKIAFGERGSNIVSAAMALANVIFYGVVVGVFVMSLEGVMGAEPGSYAVWGGILFAVVMGTTSFFGFKGVALLSKISILPMFLLFIYSAFIGVSQGGGVAAISAIPPQGEPMPLALGITGTIGIFAVGATLTGDICRYGIPGKKTGIASFLSFGVGFFLFVSLGAIAVKGTGMGDLVSVIVKAGGPAMTWIGFLLLLISSWTSGDNNVYSAGLALSKMFKLPKYYFTVTTIIIGAIIASTGVYNNLFAYLGILAMLIPPIGAIIAIDYFWVKKDVKDKMEHISDINLPAISAWVIAVLFDFIFSSGFVVKTTIGISGINSLVIGAVCYVILAAVWKPKKEK